MTENMDKWASRHRKIEKSGYQAAAKMIPFPRRWHGGKISANPETIWGMSLNAAYTQSSASRYSPCRSHAAPGNTSRTDTRTGTVCSKSV